MNDDVYLASNLEERHLTASWRIHFSKRNIKPLKVNSTFTRLNPFKDVSNTKVKLGIDLRFSFLLQVWAVCIRKIWLR